MADFEFEGLAELMDDLAAIAEIPDDVAEEMLRAQAAVVIAAQKASASAHGLVDSGQLQNSIGIKGAMKKKGLNRYVDVSPKGKRKNGVRNAEVAFIHEYGAPKRKIPAKSWIRQANESSAEQTTDAAAAVYDQFLNSRNL